MEQKWGGETYTTVMSMSPTTPVTLKEPTFEELDLSPEEFENATQSSHRRQATEVHLVQPNQPMLQYFADGNN